MPKPVLKVHGRRDVRVLRSAIEYMLSYGPVARTQREEEDAAYLQDILAGLEVATGFTLRFKRGK